MAESPIGERPSVAGYRRSSSQFTTLPTRSLSFHERAAHSQDDATARVLYQHSNVRIFKFKPDTEILNSLDSTKKTLQDADYPIDAIEILPWRSRTEFLEAEGKLVVEKVRGSSNFLKAGPSLYTIMRNSQCWCVDGEAKFVMRIGQLRYLRIEFPGADAEQRQKVEEWKEVIGTILRYEKTPCPFIRGFQVDLPDDAITPRRRGMWKRSENTIPITPNTDPSDVRKLRSNRTMSMRGMPPTSFPSRSSTQTDMDRPRTASTPIRQTKVNFTERTESPTTFSSGEEYTDSDPPDSRSDRHESGQHSEVDESDKETAKVPMLASPLKPVTTPNERRSRASLPNVKARAATLERRLSQTREVQKPVRDAANIPTRQLRDVELDAHDPLFATLLRETKREVPQPLDPRYFPKPGYINGGSLHDYEFHQQQAIAEKVPLPRETSPELLNTAKADDAALSGDGLPSPSTNGTTEQALDVTANLDDLMNRSITPGLNDGPSHLNRVEDLSATFSQQVEPQQEVETPDSVQLTSQDDDAASVISTDSFHTMVSEDAPVEHATLSIHRPSNHRREISELTITPSSLGGDDSEAIEDDTLIVATDPGQEDDDDRAHTPMPPIPQSELRQRLKHRRSLSPMPPESILETSPRNANDHAIPKALLRKAATLAVFKPIEVIAFVVHVLTRIAQGATMNDLVNGELFRRPGMRRTASGTFEQNIRGRSATAVGSEDEDDYGIPVRSRRKSSVSQSQNETGRKLSDDVTSVSSLD